MTYDQAQSPRLGQRVPVESTYVQMFAGEEIPEAAWRGQLIYRVETQGLQIYDDKAGVDGKGGWLEVTAGVFGIVTIVGPAPPPVSGSIGDIWFNTDEGHHQYRAASVGADEIAPGEWESVQDGAIAEQAVATEAVQGQADDLSSSLEDVAETAFSAQNAADTADGRISMSDYEPDPGDVEGRNEGSVWFTRTRNRTNMADNPSVEVDTSNWTGTAATIARVNATPAIDGVWVLQITNTAAAGSHSANWSSAVRQACVEGQTYTASIYADLVTGAGTGASVGLLWYDSAGSLLSTSQGGPVDLLVGDWERLYVSDVAPTGAVSFYASVVNPNASAVWRADGLLVEQSDELGRYFDGSSYDASWDGVAHSSTSTLNGDKITRIFELHDGDWVRKYLNADTLAGIDTLAISGHTIIDNTLPASAAETGLVLASEALAAGDLVNVWNDTGLFKARKASAAFGLNYVAHGFVLSAAAAGALVRVIPSGLNPLSGLSPGPVYLSTTPGKVTNAAPAAVGTMVQRVGFATSDTLLSVAPLTPIQVI